MSKKKQQRNGFFYFMLDMQKDLREQGKDIPMRDIPIFAGPSWSKLSDAQKQRYNTRAKEKRGSASTGSAAAAVSVTKLPPNPVAVVGRRNCLGNAVTDINPDAVKRHKMQEECRLIHDRFLEGGRIAEEIFFLIDIQSLYEIPQKQDIKYMPCEVAVVKYSLSEGIMDKFHCFIKPGMIPIGYRYLAQSTSDATHQIPVEGEPSAVRDYRQILGKMEVFISSEGKIPPIFAKEPFVERVEWCLEWLADMAGVANRINQVYLVENLISQLTLHVNNPRSPFFIEDLLQTSNYDHDISTRCGFHEHLESTHCSLGICHTYCYAMSEFLCKLYGISLTSKHLPTVPKLNVQSSQAPSNWSSRNSSFQPSRDDSSYQGSMQMARGRGRGMPYKQLNTDRVVGHRDTN